MQRIAPAQFSISLLKKEKLSQDAYAFFFTRPTGFMFLPGQYVRLTLPHEHPDDRGITRLFSLTTSPLNTKFLRITTRIIKSSFKKALVSMDEGQTLTLFGPMGQFTFDESNSIPHVFLAGGIGITPFISMLSYIADKSLSVNVLLLVSFTSEEDVIYFDLLKDIAAKHPKVRVVYSVTHPLYWNGESGRISEEMIKKYATDIRASVFYLAGPGSMVSAMEEIVRSLQVGQDQIKKETFVGY